MAKKALLICDMWCAHWCRTATAGLDELVERLDRAVDRFRSPDRLVIHAPSETMAFYVDHPARKRVIELGYSETPGEAGEYRPEGCQCNPPCGGGSIWKPSRQHPAIKISADDAILDQGAEMGAVLQVRSIDMVYVTGVHTNMCVIDRPFAIRQLRRWQKQCALVEDLTEAFPVEAKDDAMATIRGLGCSIIRSEEMLTSLD